MRLDFSLAALAFFFSLAAQLPSTETRGKCLFRPTRIHRERGAWGVHSRSVWALRGPEFLFTFPFYVPLRSLFTFSLPVRSHSALVDHRRGERHLQRHGAGDLDPDQRRLGRSPQRRHLLARQQQLVGVGHLDQGPPQDREGAPLPRRLRVRRLTSQAGLASILQLRSSASVAVAVAVSVHRLACC